MWTKIVHLSMILMFLACYMFGNSSSNHNWWSVKLCCQYKVLFKKWCASWWK